MPKTRLNLSLDQDLVDFIKVFAAQNRMTIADVVTQYLAGILLLPGEAELHHHLTIRNRTARSASGG